MTSSMEPTAPTAAQALPAASVPADLAAKAARWLPLIIVAATFVRMAAFSWEEWPDVLVDFGHELYVPWQLSQGKALLRDIAWTTTGPLSPYLNAGLFFVFGPSLRVLTTFNLLLLALTTWLLFDLLRALFGRFAATAACVTFLSIFAFAQCTTSGNYNFVAPYSHGITHGLLLSFLSVWLMFRYLRSDRVALLAGAGLCLGLVSLTKPEIFIACAAALTPALWLARRRGAAFLVAAATPPVIAFLLLLLSIPAGLAWRVTLAPWVFMVTSGAPASKFYLQGMGLDRPAANLALMARWVGVYAVLIPIAAIDSRVRLRAQAAAIAAAAVAVLTAVLLIAGVSPPTWLDVARPLPVIVLAAGLGYVAVLVRGKAERSRVALGLMLSVFSLVLLLKMLLNARVYHYGFALAMPATLLVVGWLTGSLPGWLQARFQSGALFRGVALGAIGALVASYVALSARSFDEKTYAVGSDPDIFLADNRGWFVNEILSHLEEAAPPDATLAVLPEGVMINYLSRHANPTPFLTFMADSAVFFGGDAPLLNALKATPPDLILLVQRDTSEHGARFFGKDYAQATMSWIAAHYAPTKLVGAPPFQGPDYGMLLLTRQPGIAP